MEKANLHSCARVPSLTAGNLALSGLVALSFRIAVAIVEGIDVGIVAVGVVGGAAAAVSGNTCSASSRRPKKHLFGFQQLLRWGEASCKIPRLAIDPSDPSGRNQLIIDPMKRGSG